MMYPRRRFGAVTMEAPPGLFEDDEAPAKCIAALTALAPATLRLWKIEPDGASDLSALMARLCDGAVREVTAIGEDHVWPGIAADVEGDPKETHYLFEHDGAFIHGVACAARALWADYGPFLEMAMLSLDIGARPALYLPLFAGGGTPELTRKPEVESPSVSLDRRLAGVAAEAQRLIAQSDFERAEAFVRAINADIYGASALMQIYEAALAQAPTNARIYERALYWARAALPEPHTEIEAEKNEAAITEREAALNRIYRGD